jgi:competence protein ComEA
MHRFAIPFLMTVNIMFAAVVAGQGLLDVNRTSKATLETLKGVGPKWADAIVKGRPYKDADDLLAKKIVPESVYYGIKDKIIARRFDPSMS